MQQTATTANNKTRITVIDAIRGLTLIGIVATHAFQHFGAFASDAAPPFPWVGRADEITVWILQYFVMGKFFIIFSFLFGLSFFIQMDSASRKGIDFRGRFLWRLTLLFLIGLLHSAIFRNDILIIYAVLGVPLVMLHKVPSKWLIALALFFVLGGAQLSYLGYKKAFPNTGIAQEQVESATERRARWQEIFVNKPFVDNLQHNLTEQIKFKFNFQFGEYGRGYMTMGFFILGLLAGRIRFFQNMEQNWPKLKKLAFGALAALLLLYALRPMLPQGEAMSFAAWLPTPINSIIDLLTAYIWIIVIAGAYRSAKVAQRMQKLESYGRMGLTNYILQSVLGVLVFYGYGLGLHQQMGVFFSVAICLAYTVIQIYLSHYWLQRFKYGPVEWLWRSGTYLKWQPLLR